MWGEWSAVVSYDDAGEASAECPGAGAVATACGSVGEDVV